MTILFTTLGVTTFYGEFVKIKIGPFFILELCFLLWVFLSLAAAKSYTLMDQRLLRAPALFFLWGALLAFRDVLLYWQSLHDSRVFMRFAQHTIIFIYPLLWMAAGIWVVKANQGWAQFIVFAVLFFNAIPNFLGHSIENYSIGPLIAVPLMLSTKSLSINPVKLWNWLFTIALSMIAFIPFWQMWWEKYVLRTSLMLLLFLMAATAFLLKRQKNRVDLKFCIPFLIFFVGIIFISFTARKIGTSSSMSEHFLAAMQKTEDIPYAENPAIFQARSRKFWWKTSLQDWKVNPIFGIGFIPEVPSFLEENMPNNWDSVLNNPRLRSHAPVSGPHNSYLSILTRMGIIGFLFFLGIVVVWLRGAFTLINQDKKMGLFKLLVILVPCCGAIHALLNVGLEAPQNCMVMWLFVGMTLGLSKGKTPNLETKKAQSALAN